MVTPRYFPYMGGIETHVHEVGRRLAQNGARVTLLTSAPPTHDKQLPREEMVEGMRVIRVPTLLPQSDFYISSEFYTLISKGSWDIVHCQGAHTAVPVLAMLAAQHAKIPYVVTFHTGGHPSPVRSKLRGVQWQLLRSLFAGADKLIGVSRFEAEYFSSVLRLPEQRFTVIPNGATLPELPKDMSARPVHGTLLVSTGRLERYKGHHRLIAALPKIREQIPDARLLIIGAGAYETALRELVQKTGMNEYVEIRAIPSKNRQEMAATLAQASLVALLSEYEAHPIAVMEALSLNRPVLVADTSGLHELAEQGFVRAIPLHSTKEEVARAVVQQIQNPLVPSQIALPTWENCVQDLQDVYTSIVRGKSCVF
jgi:glycosyltransferase involved in cell wall biosynthesis